MKNRLLPLFVVLGAYSAYSQVGVGTLSPKSSAQLEVFSNNKGMLIPQIALTSTTDTQTIVNGNIVSLLVYNTTDNANITPGYYYWFDNRWNRMLISGDLTAIAGNSVPGAKGEPGYPGKNVTIYTDKTTSIVYVQNSDGTWSPINGSSGIPGKDGKSAFEIWAELPENNGKTVIEYLASLKGDTGEVGVAGGTGAPGNKGEAGYPGEGINMYVDNSTGDVYVQKPDGTWTPINGKDGEVGTAGGNGVPGAKGEPGYPGENVNIYTDNSTHTVYVQNTDGTWTPINGEKGDKGDKGEVGVAGGTGAPGNKGEAGYPGEGINMYVDNSTGDVYVQKPDGTWTPINGKDGEVGTAGGDGAPGNKGEAGYPGENVNIYTDNSTHTVYIQNADGTWTPITGAKGDKGDKGDTGLTGAQGPIGLTGAAGAIGPQGAAGIGGKTNGGTNVTITGDGTEASPYVVNATVPQQAIDEFTADAGQTSFTLAATPSNLSKVKLYINGVRIDKDALTVTDKILTYKPESNGSYILMVNDNVIIDYLK